MLITFLELLHEVSLRVEYNRMNAFNLAVVVCPNLVKGKNPMLDITLCQIPTTQSPMALNRPVQTGEGKTTLGQVMQLCIQRYYEIFDDVPDRTEALPAEEQDAQELIVEGSDSRITFSPSLQSPQSYKRDSMIDDDEDIDDAMLVMPLGPSASARSQSQSQSQPQSQTQPQAQPAFPPSSWMPASQATPYSTYKPRQRKQPNASPRDFTAQSVHTAASGNGHAGATVGRSARSMISIEKAGSSRKSSISVGRGTMKKSSGSGVEAMGITASGFFSPPPSAPPVPALPERRQ